MERKLNDLNHMYSLIPPVGDFSREPLLWLEPSSITVYGEEEGPRPGLLGIAKEPGGNCLSLFKGKDWVTLMTHLFAIVSLVCLLVGGEAAQLCPLFKHCGGSHLYLFDYPRS